MKIRSKIIPVLFHHDLLPEANYWLKIFALLN
jgi:hypothetical protein